MVDEIDCLTSDLKLGEENRCCFKTDTLNSSSSSTTTTTTASSIERIKIYPEDTFLRPPLLASGMLAVLKRTYPALPAPRPAPARFEDRSEGSSLRNQAATNRTMVHNGIFPTQPINIPGRDPTCMRKSTREKGLAPVPLLRPFPRERVRFSEKVQYHGYCPDCDLQYDMENTDMHLHTELINTRLSPVHQCPSMASNRLLMENGGLSFSHSFPPSKSPRVPHGLTQQPQKTILRKSTTTTV